MYGTVGGQLEEMSHLAMTFRTNASLAQQIRTALDRTLASTTWSGPAADRFRASWQEFSPSLAKLNEALIEAGSEVDQRRTALDAATR